MSFKQTWDVAKIVTELRACAAQASSPYNDGFSAWACKQDLIQVQYILQDLLSDCPEFIGESEFRKELDKRRVWKTLNDRKM